MSEIKLYFGDCNKIISELESKSIDAVITDAPYNATDLEYDKEALCMNWLSLLLDTVKDDGYLVSTGTIMLLAEIAKVWHMRFSGMWLKHIGGMRTHSAKKPRQQSEPYAVYAHPNHIISNLTWNKVLIPGKPYTEIRKNAGYKRGGKDKLDRANKSAWTRDGYVAENNGTRQQTDVIFAPSKSGLPHSERTAHPTQKPIALMETFIKWITNPGDTILDPFMGSGTTAIACLRTGRNFIGIENNEEYFRISDERIAKESERLELGL